MNKRIINILLCITILFLSNTISNHAMEGTVNNNESISSYDFNALNEKITGNYDIKPQKTEKRTDLLAWKKMEKIVNTETIFLPELSTDNKKEIIQVVKPEVKKEETIKSVWVKKATITRNIGGDENISKTVFNNGKTLDIDLDKWIEDIDDVELLYRLVQAEAGGESSLGRRLVADCVLNMSRTMNISIKMAILNPGIFDVVSSGKIFTATPSESTIQCVDTELKNQIDYGVMYFRTGHFHNFGVPYDQVGNHYFSKAAEDEVSQWHE